MFNVWDIHGERFPYRWRQIEGPREVVPVKEKNHPQWETKATTTIQAIKTKPDEDQSSTPQKKKSKKESEGQRLIRALQIMSFPVVTLSPKNTLEEAWDLIQARRFRHVPVVSSQGQLIGILSDRDLLRNTFDKSKTFVQEVMATNILSAHPNTSVREIAHVMFKEKVGAMPIMDNQGVLVGIITRSDILRAIIHIDSLELWI